MSTVISPCGRYRYLLQRQWGVKGISLPFVMLNPSTADATVDDPTIRRCMRFARDHGYYGITVVNLFALRCTHPQGLREAEDPVGPENDRYLAALFWKAKEAKHPVIAAWGCHGTYMNRAATVEQLAWTIRADLRSLGRTKNGHPRHPLYVKADQPFEPFAASVDGDAQHEHAVGKAETPNPGIASTGEPE